MKIKSGYFGELDVDQEKIIVFEMPIPGFDGMSKYFIISDDEGKDENDAETNRLFCWLHSAEEEDVAFALLDVFKVKNDYHPEIDEEALQTLKFEDGDQISVYNIVNIPEKIDDMTVNLLAPIVINLSKMVGKQIILGNEEYSLKHKIFSDIKNEVE